MTSREKIILIDGSGYFFRAYYAIQRLTNSKGFPTNAIYGFINMLLRVLEVEKPTKLAICFDTAKPSFRKDVYNDYKANREAPPDDLVVQIPFIQQAVDCFGIRRLELEGFEADDVIGTVAKKAEKDGFDVDIITGDKDLMQLVNPHVRLYDTMKDKRIDAQAVKEKFGVSPDRVVDVLALMGDSSDNIPGVSGIGEKTAAELINQFGSLDGLYKKLKDIKQPKRRETLEKEKDQAYLSYQLATIHTDVPVKYHWKELDYRGPDKEQLRRFCEQMEFQSLMKRLGLEPAHQKLERNYTCVQEESALKKLIVEIEKSPWIAIDTETTSLTIHDAKVAGISISTQTGKAYYIPVGHHEKGQPGQLLLGQLDEDFVRRELKAVLEGAKVKKVGQNLKYDIQILKNFGIELGGVLSDTLLESYLLDPDQPHNLDSLAFRFLGHQNITYEQVTGKGKNQILFSEVPIEKAAEYSAEDADVTYRLHDRMTPMVKKAGLTELLHEVEVPLVGVLARMEYDGVLVDGETLKKMGIELERDLHQIQEKIYDLAGTAFNINSPKQLSDILFKDLKLPVIRKTKTGISTDESVLEALSKEHDICKYIIKFRELSKVKSTYVDGLLATIHPKTKRVHTNYNQTVTATGRLSSSNPNLQNIPSGHEKYDLRTVFIAPPKHVLIGADYSQVELRLLADMSGDKELLQAFKHDEDVHAYTGRLIFGKKEITPEERKVAKTINFGVVYGQTPFGLSQTLKITPGEAKQFIDAYFKRYASVKTYLHELVEEARKTGFARTRLGRRRYLSEINSSNRMRREMAERAAINTPLQGAAADLIKTAMVNIDKRLKQEKLLSRMILQVHDELVFEVPENEKSHMEKLIKEEMESAFKLSIPLKVDMGSGKSWRECE